MLTSRSLPLVSR